MELVVEANIVFQALIKRGFILGLIRSLSKTGIKLCSPEFVFDEIKKREERLLKYSGLTKAEFEFVMKLLFKKIKIVPKSEYSKFLPEALEIFPHHSKDAPYFALAMASKELELWSDEKRHKQQSKVKVLSTSDIKKLFGIE